MDKVVVNKAADNKVVVHQDNIEKLVSIVEIINDRDIKKRTLINLE